MLIFSRRRLSASAENISCHWVCEIIRVIHDPVAKNYSALPASRASRKNQHEGSSRTRKKIRSFLSKNFLQDFSVFTEKISKKNLPLSARSEMLIFRDGASQRAQRTFLATGSVKLSGLFDPVAKCSLRSLRVVRLEKINMRGGQ